MMEIAIYLLRALSPGQRSGPRQNVEGPKVTEVYRNYAETFRPTETKRIVTTPIQTGLTTAPKSKGTAVLINQDIRGITYAPTLPKVTKSTELQL
jgi:hypothetical protein